LNRHGSDIESDEKEKLKVHADAFEKKKEATTTTTT
jgi:hypothetical protein